MSKRHNRKRTRSRPRHRDGGKARSINSQMFAADTLYPLRYPSFHQLSQFPLAVPHAGHWLQTYSTWQHHRCEQEQALQAQHLRFFGGEAGDEVSLFEPMLKVVTDLFDGNTDYEDP